MLRLLVASGSEGIYLKMRKGITGTGNGGRKRNQQEAEVGALPVKSPEAAYWLSNGSLSLTLSKTISHESNRRRVYSPLGEGTIEERYVGKRTESLGGWGRGNRKGNR